MAARPNDVLTHDDTKQRSNMTAASVSEPSWTILSAISNLLLTVTEKSIQVANMSNF